LEKNRESTVEVAQEEVAPTKACSKASQVMIFAVNNIGTGMTTSGFAEG